MPRFEIASRLALVGALAFPAFASGQAVEPPAQPSEARPPESKPFRSLSYPEINVSTLRQTTGEPRPPEAVAQESFDYLRFHPKDASSATFVRNANEDPFLSYYGFFNAQKPVEIKPWHDAPLQDRFGIELAEVDDALRSQLEIPAGQGVVVVSVKPASLAEHAGLKPNDVLMQLGDNKAANAKDASKVLLNLGKKALEVKLIREGKPSRMSLVGPEHGFPPEAAEYWIGVPVSPVDAVLRAHLPTLVADAGLIANDVVKGSPADKAGLHKNDILATMNGKPLKNSDALIEQIQATEGKPVPVEIFRGGKPITVTVAPEKRTHPTTIKVFNRVTTPEHVYVVRPNVGIEVEPGTLAARYKDLYRTHGNYVRELAEKPIDIQLQLQQVSPKAAEAGTARIEAQLKEVSTKLDAILKAIEQVNGSTKK